MLLKQAAVVGVPYTAATLALKRAAIHKGEISEAGGCALVDLARGKGYIVYTATRKDGNDINTTTDPHLGALNKLTSRNGVDVVIDTAARPHSRRHL